MSAVRYGVVRPCGPQRKVNRYNGRGSMGNVRRHRGRRDFGTPPCGNRSTDFGQPVSKVPVDVVRTRNELPTFRPPNLERPSFSGVADQPCSGSIVTFSFFRHPRVKRSVSATFSPAPARSCSPSGGSSTTVLSSGLAPGSRVIGWNA